MPRPKSADSTSIQKSLSALIASLSTLPLADLKSLWQQLFDATPFSIHRPVLLPCLAYHLQAKEHGGLSRATQRHLDDIADDLAAGRQPRFLGPPKIRPGTRLIRSWHGEVHEVTVTDHGYLYREKTYASLTEIAFIITGAKWSGPRFFGLTSPKVNAQLRGDA